MKVFYISHEDRRDVFLFLRGSSSVVSSAACSPGGAQERGRVMDCSMKKATKQKVCVQGDDLFKDGRKISKEGNGFSWELFSRKTGFLGYDDVEVSG